MRKRELRIFVQNIKRMIRPKDGLNFHRRRRKIESSKVQYYAVYVMEIAAVVLLAFLLTISFGKKTMCNGQSMEPTIPESSSLWLNRFSYWIGEPKVGDVVAFKPDGNPTASDSVKRIVAVPGDVVQIDNGKLYINGEVVELKDEEMTIEDAGRAATVIPVAENEYFVLGDNVNSSEDSRYESVGNVARRDLLGKVWFNLSIPGFGLVE